MNTSGNEPTNVFAVKLNAQSFSMYKITLHQQNLLLAEGSEGA